MIGNGWEWRPPDQNETVSSNLPASPLRSAVLQGPADGALFKLIHPASQKEASVVLGSPGEQPAFRLQNECPRCFINMASSLCAPASSGLDKAHLCFPISETG